MDTTFSLIYSETDVVLGDCTLVVTDVAADTPGPAGAKVELQTSSTHLQYKYEGEAVWVDLISFNEMLDVEVLRYIEDTVEPADPEIPLGSILYDGPTGADVHNDFDGRDAADAHPLASITGLTAALAGKTPLSAGTDLGNISGAVSLALVDGNSHAAAIDNNVTSWGFSGLTNKVPVATFITNPTGKTVSSTGLNGLREGDLDASGLSVEVLAAASWVLFSINLDGTYYHWGLKRS